VVNGTLSSGTHLIVRHNGDEVDVPLSVAVSRVLFRA
jgi:hypothetical protein